MTMYEKDMKHGKIRMVTHDNESHHENYEFVDTCNGRCEDCDKHTVEVDEYCIFGSEYDKCADGINKVVVMIVCLISSVNGIQTRLKIYLNLKMI